MTPDELLTTGLVLCALAIPAMASALVDGRPPRSAMLTLLIAFGLIIWAERVNPGGYRLADVPTAFYSVIGSILR
ncbi:hypothetical protein ACFO5X_01830 [Seohaeicola nanhaiensis]|uniref:50S ribosomal protein L35 n=1 Tax=Seohaeicola nanhaiensis TaxID=1387282 RepID=A0ABV9KBG4_9RHOB